MRAGWTAATGSDLYVTDLRDDRGRASPQFMPETKKTAYGGPTVKAWLAATAMTLNSFFGNLAVATGFGSGLRASDVKGNKALRMVIDLVALQLVERPQNPAAHAGYLERQRKAAASGH